MLLFRIDLGSRVGGGHLSRCLSLASKIKCYRSVLLVKERGFLPPLHSGFGEHLVIKDQMSYENELDLLTSRFDRTSICICDLSNEETIARKQETKDYLCNLKKFFKKLIVIDGRDMGRIIDDFDGEICDLLITPYIGAQKVSGSFCHLRGEKYFVLPRYEKRSFRRSSKGFSDKSLKLLLTFGQADPQCLTEFTLGSILDYLSLKSDITTRVVMGSLVPSHRVEKVRILLSATNLQFELLVAPESLQDSYEWADMAISATGLSKYEIAYFGLPAILLSATQLDATLQVPFDGTEVALHLGFYRDLQASVLIGTIDNLYRDLSRRSLMSVKGEALIDGQGADRIVEKVLDFIESKPRNKTVASSFNCHS